MKRTIAIACLMLLAGLSAHAIGGIKLVELGLKAGISTRDIDFTKGADDRYNLSIDSRLGYHVGIAARVNLALFHIQPEILYSTSRYDFHASGGADSHANVRLNMWDFPIMFGMKFLIFRIQAGPVFNMATDNRIKSKGGTMPNILFSRSSVAYAAGVGCDLGQVNIDVRYNGQFKSPRQNITIGNETSYDAKTRLNNWMFSVGYMF